MLDPGISLPQTARDNWDSRLGESPDGKKGEATVTTLSLLYALGSFSPILAHPLTRVAGVRGRLPGLFELYHLRALRRQRLCSALKKEMIASVSCPTASLPELTTSLL